jgi:hypothetical protein
VSVVLRRGDRIHIALPISPTLYGDQLRVKLNEDAATLATQYAAQGVTIAYWTAHTACTHPHIVAVFRDTEGSNP